MYFVIGNAAANIKSSKFYAGPTELVAYTAQSHTSELRLPDLQVLKLPRVRWRKELILEKESGPQDQRRSNLKL